MASILEVMKTDFAHRGDYLPAKTGDFDVVSGLENLRQAIFHRLLTEPGTLIHRPQYGVGIKQWQNAPNSLANQMALASRIEEQCLQDPRVESVERVQVTLDDANPDRIRVAVLIKPVGYDEVTLEYVPFGEAA